MPIHHRTQRAVGSESQSSAATVRAGVAYEAFAPFSQSQGLYEQRDHRSGAPAPTRRQGQVSTPARDPQLARRRAVVRPAFTGPARKRRRAPALAFAQMRAPESRSAARLLRTIWSSPGGSARGAGFARRSRASARIGSTRPSRPERSSRRGYWIADEPTVSVRWSEDRVGRLGPFAAVGLDCAAPDKGHILRGSSAGKARI